MTATPRMLEQVFVAAGAQGDTVRKCIAFFLSYAKANGVQMSPHLKAPRTRTTGRRKRGTTESTTAVDAAATNGNGSHDLTWQQMMLTKFPPFDPEWTDDVKAKWFDGFQRLMKMGEEGAL